jgi:RNA polymerase sigma-70 factor, ECF subfamily
MTDIPRDVVIRAGEGDMQSFEQIYKAVSGFVYSVAFRITNNAADAQEVTQDVFLKIYRNLKGFRFKSSFKTWAYRITVNTAINKYRVVAKEKKRTVNYDDAIETGKTAADERAGFIEKEDAEKRVAKLLDLLNPDQRACVVLREIQGLSYQDIAETLKININTVRSRLKRARLALLERAESTGVAYGLQKN